MTAAPGSVQSNASAVQVAIVNARIRTGDARRPWADGLLVEGDRLSLVGSSAEVRKSVRAGARVIDARGSFVAARRADVTGGTFTTAAATGEGVLRRGVVADLVVLDRDPTGVPPEADGEPTILLAIARGIVVYERAGALPQ